MSGRNTIKWCSYSDYVTSGSKKDTYAVSKKVIIIYEIYKIYVIYTYLSRSFRTHLWIDESYRGKGGEVRFKKKILV